MSVLLFNGIMPKNGYGNYERAGGYIRIGEHEDNVTLSTETEVVVIDPSFGVTFKNETNSTQTYNFYLYVQVDENKNPLNPSLTLNTPIYYTINNGGKIEMRMFTLGQYETSLFVRYYEYMWHGNPITRIIEVAIPEGAGIGYVPNQGLDKERFGGLYAYNEVNYSESAFRDIAYMYFTGELTGEDSVNYDYLLYGFGKSDWKIYIDGERLPTVKILWKNEDIEKQEETESVFIDIILVSYDYLIGNINPAEVLDYKIENIPYKESFYAFSYLEALKKVVPSRYNKFQNGNLLTTQLPRICVFMCLHRGDNYSTQYACFYLYPVKKVASGESYIDLVERGFYTYTLDWATDDPPTTKVPNLMGDTITLLSGSGDEDDGYIDRKGESVEIPDTSSISYSTNNILSHKFSINRSRATSLGNELWSADFFDNIKLVNNNPIDNVVSIVVFPFETNSDVVDEAIRIGNVQMATMGHPNIKKNIVTLGTFTLKKYYNSFLDYPPYTDIKIYIPFVGMKSITFDSLYDTTLRLEYSVDYTNGDCIAMIKIDSNNTIIDMFSGKMGIEIPLTASNRASQVLSTAEDIVAGGVQVLTKNYGEAIKSVASSFFEPLTSTTKGLHSSECMASTSLNAFIVYTRPVYQEPKGYAHTYGKPCNLTKTIGGLTGFTKCENVDLSTIPCTEREKTEIKNMLENGFYV